MPIAIPLAVAAAGTAGYAALGAGTAAAIGADAAATGFAADAGGASIFAGLGETGAAVSAETAEAASVGSAASAGLTGFQELSLGASALSGVGQIGSSLATQKSAEYNAAISGEQSQEAKQSATASIQQGEANAGASSQKTKAQIGGILANQGASGVDVNSGSSLDTRASAADVGELNAINIRSQAARTAYGYQTQGVNDTAEQSMYQSQAAYAPIQGAIGAGTSLLSGAAAANNPWLAQVASQSIS